MAAVVGTEGAVTAEGMAEVAFTVVVAVTTVAVRA